MRFLTTTALAICLPGMALADDILLRADIAAALVYADSAEVTRRVEIDLTPGTHVLTIPMRDLVDPNLIEVTGPDGMTIGAPEPTNRVLIPEGALDTNVQAQARADLEAAEARLQAAEDALDRRDAVIAGYETQLDLLASLAEGGAEAAAALLDPAQLSETLTALGEATSRTALDLQEAEQARRTDEDLFYAREREFDDSLAAFEALRPFDDDEQGIRLTIDAPDGGTGTISLTYLTGGAGWRPEYALRLDTVSGALDVERTIALSVASAAIWQDVDARFSTAIPSRQRVPGGVLPDPVRIGPPAPAPLVREEIGAADMAQAIMVEPVMIAETVEYGLSVVYDYGTPVAIGPTGRISLPLDTLTLPVDLENRAVPRRDANAFLMAVGDNSSGAPILPGRARFFRDGDLIGTDFLPLIPAGAAAELAFGPLDHLQLTWLDLSRDEGDRGFFASENEMQRRIAFTVENTSQSAEEVRLLYAAPFSEQEDLELSVGWSRAPDETDVDDLRGVAAWSLTVPPGEETRIDMTVEMRWPEDMVLTWWP